jgi:glycosyltransferase involved in cell wall biosynthesis
MNAPVPGVRLPIISLVMCTIGRTDPLLRLIKSLVEQTCTAFELVIVDQNPEGYLDPLVACARESLSVQCARSEPGLSRARNVGLELCRGDIVAFPDDDCWYPPDLIWQLLELFRSNAHLGIVTGRTTDTDGRDSNGKFVRSSCKVTRSNVWFCGTSNSVFVRRELALKLKGFNEALGVGSGTAFGSGEETDFLLRAFASGAQIFFFRDLLVHHDQTGTELNDVAFRRAASYARGFGRVLRLNRYSSGYMAYRVARNVVAAVVACLTMNAAQARLKWVWARGTVVGYLARSSGV